MKGTTHFSIGLATGLLTVNSVVKVEENNNLTELLLKTGFVSIVAVASLLPDIDKDNSQLGRYFKPIGFTMNLISKILNFISKILEKMTSFLPRKFRLGKITKKASQGFGHRGLSHSIWLLLLLVFLSFKFENYNLIFHGMIIGVLTHFLSDAITKRGIPLFYPLNIKFKIANFNANGNFNKVLFTLSTIIILRQLISFTPLLGDQYLLLEKEIFSMVKLKIDTLL